MTFNPSPLVSCMIFSLGKNKLKKEATFCICGDVFSGIIGKTVGGGANQLAALAIELAAHGFKVVVVDIAFNSGAYKHNFFHNNIEIFLVRELDFTTKLFKTFTFYLPKYFSILKLINADYYLTSVRGYQHIIPYFVSRKIKSKFIYWVAADLDVETIIDRYQHHYKYSWSIKNLFNYILIELFFPYMLANSDYVLTQHSGQSERLLSKGIKSYLFPNIIMINSDAGQNSQKCEDYLLFVGSLDKRKGIELLFELVKNYPNIQFLVLGKTRDSEGAEIVEKMSFLENVKFLGQVDNSLVTEYLKKSIALVNTSFKEGFPITFLETWSCGKPVISFFVDPGGVIANYKLGFFLNGEIERFGESIQFIKMVNHKDVTKTYVNKNHNIANAVDNLMRIIKNPS